MNWNYTKEEGSRAVEIAHRAEKELSLDDRLILEMDILACHCNDIKLDLDKLFHFPAFDFMHDITGIQANLDRETGKLRNCFVPRCASTNLKTGG